MVQRNILVTGSSSGIGRACAELFTKRGDNVLGVDQIALESAVYPTIVGDLSLDKTLDRVVDALESNIGLDVLINCAAIVNEDDPWELTVQDWLRIYEVNVVSVYRLTAKVLPYLKAAINAAVVNIGSIAGQRSGEFSSPCYAASKAALIGLNRSFARLLAPNGIRVNCVNPGVTWTPMIEHWQSDRRRGAEESVPLGRLGSAEDIAATVEFLVSQNASYITGAQFDVNGGLHMA